MTLLSRYFCITGVLMLASASIAASDAKIDPVLHRPKICLALSGGGARGAAHIGVLKVLEEYRIPIDCVVGTSMGALVGGAYASGMSVSQMEEMLTSLSSDALFQDKPPRAEQAIRRKEEDYTSLFSPEMGVGSVKGNTLPKGMVSGVQLETVLRKLTVSGYRNFDNLPIPYRAVATDLVTGGAVVFKKGEMANVMRASMSVPVAIAPVEMDGKMLVDGMLVDNLPIDVARSMGADIIIAVNVGTPLMKQEELGSILGVAGQMLSILTEQNVQKSLSLLKPDDILISPALGDFTTGDFDHLAQTLPIGEAAARTVAAKLSKLSLTPQQYEQYRLDRVALSISNEHPIDAITFKELKHVNPTYLESMMGTKAGEPIDQAVLDKDLRRLYGLGDFEHVGYQIVSDDTQNTLLIDATEKSWGPDYVRFGLGLNTDFHGDSEFNIQGRLRKTWLNSYGAESLTDIQIGSTNRIMTQWYQPVNPQQTYYVTPTLEWKQDTLRLFYEGNELALYDLNVYRAGLNVGYDLDGYGKVYAGAIGGILKGELRIGAPEYAADSSSIALGAFTAGFELDKLDSVAFPKSGWSAKGSLYSSSDWLGAADVYTKGEVQGNYVYSFGANTFNLYALAQGSLDGTLPDYDQYKWGGFLHQSGYQRGELLAGSLLYSRVIYTNKLMEYQAFDGLYAGFSLEAGKIENPLVVKNPTDLMLSASAFLATDSPIGPLYFGYGQAKSGEGSFYFFLGLPY